MSVLLLEIIIYAFIYLNKIKFGNKNIKKSTEFKYLKKIKI